MKITEYDKITDLGDNRVILTDGDDGTKTVAVSDLLYKLIDYGGSFAGKNRRNTTRGKELGSTVSADQWAKIADGSFTDMFLGDYWLISGKHYRIWDIDYLLKTGNTNIMSKHHLIIVPDESFVDVKMNTTNTTATGYSGAAVRTSSEMTNAKSVITSAFGASHVLTYDDILTTAVSNGIPSAFEWKTNLTVELMSETMVYGCRHLASGGTGTVVAAIYTVFKSQFALPQLDPSVITTRFTYWLRDVVSGTFFSDVNCAGHAGNNSASNAHGLRPFFVIG